MEKQIEKALEQEITIIRSDDEYALFHCEDGMLRNCKITKLGKLKKNSIRVA